MGTTVYNVCLLCMGVNLYALLAFNIVWRTKAFTFCSRFNVKKSRLENTSSVGWAFQEFWWLSEALRGNGSYLLQNAEMSSWCQLSESGKGWWRDDAKFYAADFPLTAPPTPSRNYVQLIFPWDLSIFRTMFILVHSHWALGVCDPMSHLCNQQWLQHTALRTRSIHKNWRRVEKSDQRSPVPATWQC